MTSIDRYNILTSNYREGDVEYEAAAELSGLSYFNRTRVGTLGTAQFTPRYQENRAGPLRSRRILFGVRSNPSGS